MNKTEKAIINILAACEQSLAAIATSVQEGLFVQNEIVEHNVEFATQSIVHALEKLAQGDTDKARLLAEIALLRCHFASQTFDIERTELLLGEADYLELSTNWRKQAENSLANITRALDNIQNASRVSK